MKARLGGYGIPLAGVLLLALAPAAQPTMGPSLQRFSGDSVRIVQVVVLLETRSDPAPGLSWGRRPAYNENRITIERDNDQQVASFLSRAANEGFTLGAVQTFWLAPFVSLAIDERELSRLGQIPGVAAIIEDAPIDLIAPRRAMSAGAAADATSAGQVVIGAPDAWHKGLTGKGTLVASIDTGVDGHHPALLARYRGQTAQASSTWMDATGQSFPNDPSGHGTHTMGTVLGSDGADTVGVAPGAEWIAAGVVDRGKTFGGTISDLLTAFQWLADPDGNPATLSDVPDVVLNSWGIPQGILPACDNTFWQVTDNLEALGVLVIFAAGNEGPYPSTLRLPADRGDAPLKCFSVGAVDAADPLLATPLFSSRGPATCNSGIIKPELVAPGVNVRSCKPGGGYQILSGTSMAAPHVAGAVAILRQANPEATADEIKHALTASAIDLGDPGPDFVTGFGLLNLAGALSTLPPARPVAWDFSVPVIEYAVDGTTAALSEDLSVRLYNRGCGLKRVQIDLVPVDPADLLGAGAHTELDHLGGDQGVVDLVLNFAELASRVRGERVWMNARIRAASPVLDTTVMIGLPVGDPGPLEAMPQSAGALTGVASNFGRFDAELAESAGANVARFNFGGGDVPFAGGLRIFSGTRDRSSFGPATAFEPAPDVSLAPGDGGVLSTAVFRDTRLADPIGIEFVQTVFGPTPGPGAYLLYEFGWRRLWASDVTEPLQFGAWMHWDLDGTEQALAFSSDNASAVTNGKMCVGAVLLGTEVLAQEQAFDSAFASLPRPVAGQSGGAAISAESFLLTLTALPVQGGSGRFAVALVAADNPAEWDAAAQRARDHYAELAAGGGEVLPAAFELLGNYPNPFNPTTRISYALDLETTVRIDVYNVMGQRVRTLWDSPRSAGRYEIDFDGRGQRGEPLASGVYFLHIRAGGDVRTAKMTLLR
jgi:subtilisin family serine protease